MLEELIVKGEIGLQLRLLVMRQRDFVELRQALDSKEITERYLVIVL